MSQFICCALGLILTAVTICNGKTLDNRLVGSPEVECGPDAIRIRGESEDIFEGQIFIKNQRRSDDCFVVYSVDDNTTLPEFTLSLTRIASCGIDMRRNPSRGLELFSVFVFAFHPSFVTAGDRAFAVHCLFQQQQITVSTRFDFISDITPKAVIGATSSVPAVQLTIVQGRVPTGAKPAGAVSVGEPLMLVWHTELDSHLYGVRVLDCTAETRDRRGMGIIRDGCTTDNTLISDVRYADNHQRAFADATAFKFPDLTEVWFRCAVQLCIRRFDHLILTGKSEDDLCENVSKCGMNLRQRRRVSSDDSIIDGDNIIEVTGRVSVDDDSTMYYYAAQVSPDESSTVCMSKDVMALGSAVSVTVCVSTFLTVASFVYAKLKRKCSVF
ncbi:hypothetical protein Y032_0203g1841 [Ancylostoma ceylanicum]|uniref:ZP domain-containing protein n=1 Tax=Ancylostoma ceylanicum TaxID=53326 RepID=A0A016SMZ2_9BILA|nr:hypothetical protein Y032_0203g1841 [Ancylostoma ceylanicum]